MHQHFDIRSGTKAKLYAGYAVYAGLQNFLEELHDLAKLLSRGASNYEAHCTAGWWPKVPESVMLMHITYSPHAPQRAVT